MTDWADLLREQTDLLREIVEAWCEDEFHDVPMALIDRAREVLRRVGEKEL